ncbi:MAG: hypothetical protein LUD48_04485 [Prevotella sp.]|nr:hypothetical protein [Prevotella sp.]
MEKINEVFVYSTILGLYDEAMKQDSLSLRLSALENLSELIKKHIPTILGWCSDLITEQTELQMYEVRKGYNGNFENLQIAVYDRINENLLNMGVEDIVKFSELGVIESAKNKYLDEDDEDDIFRSVLNRVQDYLYLLRDGNGTTRYTEYKGLAHVPALAVCCYTAIQNDIRRINLGGVPVSAVASAPTTAGTASTITTETAKTAAPSKKVQKQIEKIYKEGKSYFVDALDYGLLETENGKYSWCSTQELLSIFCYQMGIVLGLSFKQNDNRKYAVWQPFSIIFGIDSNKLRQSLAEHKDKREYPKGTEILKKIFPNGEWEKWHIKK